MTNMPVGRGLVDKRAVVTGGASGIGLATVRRLAAEGARVMIFDMNRNALEQILQEEVEIVGGVAVDVGHPEEVARAYEQVDAQLGGIDILVANAGISYRTPFLEITPLQWNQVLTTNLTGIFYTAQQA